jgi:hypothetical protein
MPNPVITPSNLQWVGAAKETTYGTPVAAPTFWIPVDGSSIKYLPNQNMLADEALRGLMGTEYQQVAGMRHDTLDYKSYFYMDSCYQHFLAILGRPDAVSGSADPWTHKTSLENGVDNAPAQPVSFTLFWIDGLKAWQMPGAVLMTCKTTVKVDDLATLEASWVGMPATIMVSVPSNTPSTNKPIPSWSSVISVGGAAASKYSEISLEYKREVQEVPTINASQSPLEIFGGRFSVAGALTAIFEGGITDSVMAAYLANTQQAITVKLSPIGDAVHSITLQQSLVAYESGAPQGSNKWMEIQSNFRGLMNATDALDGKQSPAQVIILNAQTAAY